MAGWNLPELQSFDFEDEAESLVSISQSHPKILTITHSKTKERRGCFVIKAVEKESTESEAVERPGTESESESELSVTGELGAEIKKAMMERKGICGVEWWRRFKR
ncbi:hypothetical protein OIU79_003828 [Salix purpurea]|uniref:Uncharacterized protein n=1 Tax=Salix purpurea TaxID=77065 RepID=A0A9Q0U8T8_SALPP|nr:hypothetical protein OIU79_003828 [Salix purpurea]